VAPTSYIGGFGPVTGHTCFETNFRGKPIGPTATKGSTMITTHNIKRMGGKALLSGGVALAALGLTSGTAHAFNPQPDPPGKPHVQAQPCGNC
jgi:hypothetical protein